MRAKIAQRQPGRVEYLDIPGGHIFIHLTPINPRRGRRPPNRVPWPHPGKSSGAERVSVPQIVRSDLSDTELATPKSVMTILEEGSTSTRNTSGLTWP